MMVHSANVTKKVGWNEVAEAKGLFLHNTMDIILQQGKAFNQSLEMNVLKFPFINGFGN